MRRELEGQEVVELALISGLVFFAALFVVMAFGKNISKVFTESASGQEKQVAQFDLTEPGIALPGPNTGGVKVTIPTLDGGTGDITFPNPDYYLNRTISTSGASGFTTEIGNYTQDLAEVIEQISALTGNNPNINKLAQIIADTGNAEVVFNEKLDSENNPDLLNLDPNNTSLISDINAIIDNVDTSITQLNNETSTKTDFSNLLTGLDQYNYAQELSSSLNDVLNDPNIPQETKDILSLITGQVQSLADNVTYEVDSNLYDNVVSNITTKINPSISGMSSSTNTETTATAISITNDLNSATTTNDKAFAFVSAIKEINTNPALTNNLLINLSEQEKTDLINLSQSLNIKILMPLDTVINTTLAAQAACSASSKSWNGSGCE